MKQTIRLTESELRQVIEDVIKSEVKGILLENSSKKTRNPNTIENLTKYLHGNRGVAEMFINTVSGYVDYAVQSGELQNYEEDEVYDFFWDVVAESDKKDDMVYNLVNILKALNNGIGLLRRDSYGYLAELMEEYYDSEYRQIDKR